MLTVQMRHLTDEEISLLLDEAARAHVLDGEGSPDYRGGHRFDSSIVGKTVFPQDWTDDEIIGAIRATLSFPARVLHDSQFSVFFGLVNEVLIEVKIGLNERGAKLRHAFPVNGFGVHRNDPLGKVPLPLDLNVLEN